MFQFRRFPTTCYFIHKRLTEYCSAGFPHSDIHGSMPAFDSPWLFVDRYVLRRLPMPRHSPCALISLTFFELCVLFVNFSTRLYCSFCYPKFKSLKLQIFVTLSRCFHFTFTCIQFSRYIPLLSLTKLGFSSFPDFRHFRCLVGSRGLEPPTSRLSGVRSNHLSYEPIFVATIGLPFLRDHLGGDKRDRTADPLLAKQVLSQLSYTPVSLRVEPIVELRYR